MDIQGITKQIPLHVLVALGQLFKENKCTGFSIYHNETEPRTNVVFKFLDMAERQAPEDIRFRRIN